MSRVREWLDSSSEEGDDSGQERQDQVDRGLTTSQEWDDTQEEPEWEATAKALEDSTEELGPGAAPDTEELASGSAPGTEEFAPGTTELASSEEEPEESEHSPETDESQDDPPTQVQQFKIDPTNMSAREAILATKFLNRQLREYGNILTRKNTTHTFSLVHSESRWSIKIILEFIYDIAWYMSEKHPEEDRFAVVGHTRLGWSGACDVWKVKGKLTPSSTGTLFYHSHKDNPPAKKWVAKYEQHHNAGTTKEDSVKAYKLAKANKKLGLKHPLWMPTANRRGMSVTLMRRLKDCNLSIAVEEEKKSPGHVSEAFQSTTRWDLHEVFYFLRNEIISLSDLQALEYSLATAIAYKEQVSDIDVTHRDIKSENIMLDLSLGPHPSAFTFFDYGFARKKTEYDNAICGSIGYIAPEILERKGSASNQCDIYPLGCVLAQWFEDFSSYDELPDDDKLGLAQARTRQFTKLAPNTPPEIKALLNRMVTYNPDDRPDIDEVIVIHQAVIEFKKLEAFKPASSPSQTMAMK